jgi:DNA-directed RNA polymerase subunit RPC12/RpoP
MTRVKLPAEWWKENVFDEDTLSEASHCEEGNACTSSVISGDMKFDLAYGRRFPRCQVCKDELTDDTKWNLADVKQAVGIIRCKKCNNASLIRKPDEFVSSLFSFPVHAIIGEDPEQKPDEEYKGKLMMFACLQCGAGLKVDGSSRVVACTYCNTDNFLPEDLWRRLHPVVKPVVFFIVADYSI